MPFERRELRNGGAALVPSQLERAGFLVAFTERSGGASRGAFASLNLSHLVGDDDRSVRANRRMVVDGLGLSGPFALPEQAHGAGVTRVEARDAGAGFLDPSARLPGADALFTSEAGLPLGVLTADCLPIVLASERAGVVAVVHAGWRGLAAGILRRAVGVLGGGLADVCAAIGPAIGPDHYEVGGDVVAAVAAASDVGAVTDRRDGRNHLDLAATASAMLRAYGVDRVELAGVCTACEPDRFFSHRRDGGLTGRQAVVAVRM